MAPSPNAIGITVNDMGRALAFYRLLGLDVPAAADTEQHVECRLAGGMRLMWDSVELMRSLDPQWSQPQGGARMTLAFECADPAEVDRVYAEVVRAGYDGHKAPWDAFWRQRYAMLRDPDGNAVDLYAALPATD